MAYFELANLANNQPLLTRISYAVSTFATYILGAAPGGEGYAARLNWALRAQADPRKMAESLAPAVCRDPKVVQLLGEVSDADLQAAVETAANIVIAAPITYVDLSNLAADPEFLSRVRVAVARFATYMMGEDPATANHAARYAWAKAALMNTIMVAGTIAPAVVMDVVVGAALMGTTDAQLQVVVEKAAGQLLL